MGQAVGIATAVVQLGLESLLVKPRRNIGPFKAQVTIEEVHTDELEITDQPVEQGARISDHAFLRPAEVVIQCAWSDSPSNIGVFDGLIGAVTGTIAGVGAFFGGEDVTQSRAMYENMLALQALREPFEVYTGKRVYNNMLIKSLKVTTDKTSESSLMMTCVLRQVIIVTTRTLVIGAPPEDQAAPEETAPPEDEGDQQLEEADQVNESAGQDAIDSGTEVYA